MRVVTVGRWGASHAFRLLLMCQFFAYPLADLQIYVQPGKGQARQPLLTQPKVILAGASVSQALISVSTNSLDTSILTGTTSLITSNNWANFTDLLLRRTGLFTLTFTSSAGDSTTSTPFLVSLGLDHFTLISGAFSSSTVAGKEILPTPVISLGSSDGGTLLNSQFPVIVSAEEIGSVNSSLSIVISANFTQQTCCSFSNCIETALLFGSCCDCQNPSCALCVIPVDGVAAFPGLRINRVGSYRLIFTTNEATPFIPDSSTTGATVTATVLIPPSLISIIAGSYAGINFVLQPNSIFVIAGNQSAIFQPQPSIQKADDQGNLLTLQPRVGEFSLALVCYDGFSGLANIFPAPDHLCECSATGCFNATLAVVQQEAAVALSGTVTAAFSKDGVARFTDLTISIAYNALHVVVLDFLGSANIGQVKSTPFFVSPGNLQKIGTLLEPSNIHGCPRCPPGVLISSNNFNVTVQLLDAFGNRIAACASSSKYCQGTPQAAVIVRLLMGSADVTISQSKANLIGSGQQACKFGVGFFENLAILQANNGYTLRFFARAYNNATITSDSASFSVAPGSPSQLQFVSLSPSIVTDSEQFSAQVQLLDAQGNLVSSDCYTTCPGANVTCTPGLSSCPLPISITMLNPGLYAAVNGTLQVLTVQGTATIGPLVLQANAKYAQSCTCLVIDQCERVEPWPNYVLTAYVPGMPSIASVSIPVTLQPRLQSLVIMQQPSVVPAMESFPQAIQVQAQLCGGSPAVYSTASIEVSIATRGANSFGQLLGTRSVQISNGLAIFSDLSLSQSGTYSLQFTYSGVIVLSQTFEVLPGVSQLLLITSPGNVPSVAGVPFTIQPSVSLLDSTGNIVQQSALVVTASLQDKPGNLQLQDPGQAKLKGSVAIQAENGKVIFTDLSINKASVGQDLLSEDYTIRFSTIAAGVTSVGILVLPNSWSALFMPSFAQPEGSLAGSPLATQPSVYFVDQFLNRILPTQIPNGTSIQVSLLSAANNGAVLLRNGCDEQCSTTFPIVCTTCTSFAMNVAQSIMSFTDLRIDAETGNFPGMSPYYRLYFVSGLYNLTSDTFFVSSASPAYLALETQLVSSNPAQQILGVQPVISVRDKFGNLVVTGFGLQVKVSILLPGRPFPQAGSNGVCSLAPTLLEGNSAVNINSGKGYFTDLAVRQVAQGYILQFMIDQSGSELKLNSSTFNILPGPAVGLCVMSDFGQCSELSPCIDPAVVACVDKYGNVQPTCTACGDDGCCGTSPFNVPAYLNAPCAQGVCLELQDGPPDSFLAAWSPPQNLRNCSDFSCSKPLVQGLATFSSIALSEIGSSYQINFTAFLACNGTLFQWSTEVSANVSAAPPKIVEASFLTSLAGIEVFFNQPTNMRILPPGTCGILDPNFLLTLGIEPFCTWTDPGILLILFGDSPTVSNSTPIQLSKNAGIIARGMEFGANNATTQEGAVVGGVAITPIYPAYPDPLPAPIPVINSPRQIGTCSRFSADSSLSMGDAGRSFTSLEWGIDFTKSQTTIGILQASAPSFPAQGLSAAYFVKSHIYFSSLLPRDINTVTVTLLPSSPIIASTVLTITGLPGYSPALLSCPFRTGQEAPMSPCLTDTTLLCRTVNLRGPSAYRFGNFTNHTLAAGNNQSSNALQPRAQWDPSGALVMQVHPSHLIPTTEDTVFTFQMMNPSIFSGSVVRISASCSGSCVCVNVDCLLSDSVQAEINAWFKTQIVTMDCSPTDTNSSIPNSIVQSIPCLSKRAVFQLLGDTVSLISAQINETSTVSSATNVLTLTFLPASVMPPGLNITLSGLNGVQMPSQSLCLSGPSANMFECDSCFDGARSLFGPAARWSLSSGTIVFTVKSTPTDMFSVNQSRIPINLAFQFQNNAGSNRQSCSLSGTPQKCPSKVQPSLQFGIIGALIPIQGDVLGSGTSPTFTSASIRESNSINAMLDLITVEFSLNIDLGPTCSISLQGLPAVPNQTYSDVLSSSCYRIVTGSGQQGFILTLTINSLPTCGMPAGVLNRFSFLLRNPNQGGDGQLLYISASCGILAVPLRPLDGDAVLRGGMIVQFKNLKIGEDNAVPSQTNLIRASFQCTSGIYSGSIITISGLLGTLTASTNSLSTQVVVEHVTQTVPVQPSSFNSVLGTLVFNVSTYVPPMAIITVSFRIQNGISSVPGPVICNISALLRVEICNAQNQWCPLSQSSNYDMVFPAPQSFNGSIFLLNDVPRILVAEISESNRVIGAYNMIKMSLMCNFDVIGSSTITIHGLDGSQTTQTSSLIPVSNWIDLFPNCSCPYPEQTFPCQTCKAEDFLRLSQFRVWQPDVDDSGRTLFGLPQKTNGQPSGRATGSWVPGCSTPVPGLDCSGKLVLSTISTRIQYARTPFEFGFLLINPAKLTLAAKQIVYIASGGIIQNVSVNGSILGSNTAPAFSALSISEVSNNFGEFSILSVAFQINCPLVSAGNSGAMIVINGLTGYQTPSGYIPLSGNGSYQVTPGALAIWNEGQANLTLNGAVIPGGCSSGTPGTDIPFCSSGLVQFNFMLKSRLAISDGKAFPNIAGFSGKTVLPATTFGGDALNSVTNAPTFTLAAMRQSNLIQTQLNNISFAFQANTQLTSYGVKHPNLASTITIAGLIGSLTPDSASLPLSGQSAALFSGAGMWTRSTGILVLSLAGTQVVPPNTPIYISIILVNPNAPQQISARISGMVFAPAVDQITPASLTVAYGSPIVLSAVTLQGLDVLSAKVSPSILMSAINESTTCNFAMSTITVSFTLNVDVQPGGKILLSGLQSGTSSGTQIILGGVSAGALSNPSWDKDAGTLEITNLLSIYADVFFSFSFKLQNKNCAPAQAFSVQIIITGPSGEGLFDGNPKVSIGPQALSGQLQGCGGALLWRTREASESSGVANALNTLTFSLQPSAPLYAGTTVTIQGLIGSQTLNCLSCTAVSSTATWTDGMGCSDLCNLGMCQTLTSGVCIPIFSATPPDESTTFSPLGTWFPTGTSTAGTLIITVASSQVLSDVSVTSFSIMLWNPAAASSRVDCLASANGKCLKVTTSNVQLCDTDVTRTDSEACKNGGSITKLFSITQSSPPVNPLYDTCSTCFRSPDVTALHSALQAVVGPVFSELYVNSPSLAGKPTLISGNVVAGSYALQLTLANWLGNMASSETFIAADGAVTLDGVRPLVDIAGMPIRSVRSSDQVTLVAIGTPASCIAGYQQAALSYLWSLTCLDAEQSPIPTTGTPSICSLVPSLQSIAAVTAAATLQIPAGTLIAGANLRLVCVVKQQGLQISAQSYVNLQVSVAPLVAVISAGGIQYPAGMSFYLNTLPSYDPEAKSTGLNSYYVVQNNRDRRVFKYSWACTELQPAPPCNAAGCNPLLSDNYVCESCSPNELTAVACAPGLYGLSTDSSRFYPSIALRFNDWTIGFNGSLMKVGYTYRIELNMSRLSDFLPVALQTLPQFTQISTATFNFSVVKGYPVQVVIELCDTICNGPAKSNNLIGTNSRAILSATANATGGQAIHSYAWTILSPPSDVGTLTFSSSMTSIQSALLILRPGFLVPGHTVRLRCTVLVEDPNGGGYAEIEVQAALPPLAGSMSIVPSSGIALTTEFQFSAPGWTADADALPLTFAFIYINTDVIPTEIVISRSNTMSVGTVLPVGAGPLFLASLALDVQDTLGSITRRTRTVTVTPVVASPLVATQQLTSYMNTQTTQQFLDGDMVALQAGLSFVASSLNGASDPCALAQDLSLLPSSCSDVLNSRQLLRVQLILKLVASRLSQLLSIEGVLGQVATLKSITEKPLELNFDAMQQAMDFLTQAVADIRSLDTTALDGVSTSSAFMQVHSNLQLALMKMATPEGLSIQSVTSTVLSKAGDNRFSDDASESGKFSDIYLIQDNGFSASISDADEAVLYELLDSAQQQIDTFSPNMPRDTRSLNDRRTGSLESLRKEDEEALWMYDLEGIGGGDVGRRAFPVPTEVRSVAAQLFDQLSQISSISVQDCFVGEWPRNVTSVFWDMSTWHVAVAGFGGLQAILGNVTANIPANIFLQIDKARAVTPDTAEIMLVQFRTSLFPAPAVSLGPAIVLQIRAYGTITALPLLSTLVTPLTLLLPWTGKLQAPPDALGRRLTPFAGSFQAVPSVWAWTTNYVSLSSHSDSVIIVTTQSFGIYAALAVVAGCDGIPLGPAVLDSCGVCGGDNSTCSGCDGIPHTGRNRLCSGHGGCVVGDPLCNCTPGWYGVICNTSCLVSSTCSNQGFCDPTTGLYCHCLTGFATRVPAPKYPGPFCTEINATIIGVSGPGSADRSMVVILSIVVPAGTFVLCGAGVWLFTRHRRKKHALRRKQYNLYPPTSPATAAVVLGPSPDESGWNGVAPPQMGPVSSDFSYGPGSGQLASAVAASTRTNLDRQSAQLLARRIGLMRGRIKLGLSTDKYAAGPVLLNGAAAGDEYTTDDSDGELVAI